MKNSWLSQGVTQGFGCCSLKNISRQAHTKVVIALAVAAVGGCSLHSADKAPLPTKLAATQLQQQASVGRVIVGFRTAVPYQDVGFLAQLAKPCHVTLTFLAAVAPDTYVYRLEAAAEAAFSASVQCLARASSVRYIEVDAIAHPTE